MLYIYITLQPSPLVWVLFTEAIRYLYALRDLYASLKALLLHVTWYTILIMNTLMGLSRTLFCLIKSSSIPSGVYTYLRKIISQPLASHRYILMVAGIILVDRHQCTYLTTLLWKAFVSDLWIRIQSSNYFILAKEDIQSIYSLIPVITNHYRAYRIF